MESNCFCLKRTGVLSGFGAANANATDATAVNNSRVIRRNCIWLPKRDNGSDHRVRTIILQAEKTARKPDFACIALLSCDFRIRSSIYWTAGRKADMRTMDRKHKIPPRIIPDQIPSGELL